MPSTYSTAVENTLGSGSLARAPKMLTVTPSMGNTHGVRLSSRPPRKSASHQPSPPFSSACSSWPRAREDAAPPVAGGADTVVPVAFEAGGAGETTASLAAGGAGDVPATGLAPVTVIATVNSTDEGARHT